MWMHSVTSNGGYRILIWVDAIRTQGCLTIINTFLKKSKRINLEYSLHVRLFCDERKAIRGISSRTNVWLVLVYVRFDDSSRLSCVMWFHSIYISSYYFIALNLKIKVSFFIMFEMYLEFKLFIIFHFFKKGKRWFITKILGSFSL